MKFKVSSLAIAVAALVSLGAPASAAVVDISGVSNATNNVRVGDTEQVAVALDGSLGPVAFDSSVDLSATNLVNTATANIGVDQANGVLEFINYSAIGNVANNQSYGQVGQLAVTGSLTGAVTNNSHVTGSALNSVNLGATTITVKQ
ncbi:MAG: hypothetical protein KIH67_001735 [Candidatus Moranbacteria bacterium]|nr:hypothetical protein [Candidatus Moranbacteria bacterium]